MLYVTRRLYGYVGLGTLSEQAETMRTILACNTVYLQIKMIYASINECIAGMLSLYEQASLHRCLTSAGLTHSAKPSDLLFQVA